VLLFDSFIGRIMRFFASCTLERRITLLYLRSEIVCLQISCTVYTVNSFMIESLRIILYIGVLCS
jgi:hypothetical protein